MFNQILLWFLLIAPWFLLLFLNKHDVKRFMPAALFGALLLTIVFQMAEKFKWWKILDNILFLSSITTFVYGLFLVGTVIILYFTYNRFVLYLIVNLVIDALLAFGISKWYEHLKIYKLEKITPLGVYFITIVASILIYLYQKWQDEVIKK